MVGASVSFTDSFERAKAPEIVAQHRDAPDSQELADLELKALPVEAKASSPDPAVATAAPPGAAGPPPPAASRDAEPEPSDGGTEELEAPNDDATAEQPAAARQLAAPLETNASTLSQASFQTLAPWTTRASGGRFALVMGALAVGIVALVILASPDEPTTETAAGSSAEAASSPLPREVYRQPATEPSATSDQPDAAVAEGPPGASASQSGRRRAPAAPRSPAPRKGTKGDGSRAKKVFGI
jgi:hypothetical protein